MKTPTLKERLIFEAQQNVKTVEDQYNKGVITDGEKYTKIIDIWIHVTEEVAKAMLDDLADDQDGFNPIFVMADSINPSLFDFSA